jgi:hypothetical protein
MTAIQLNNLWTYLQGLSLKQSDREWLAGKLVEPEQPTIKDVTQTVAEKEETVAKAKKRRKELPLTPEVAMLSNLNLREFTQEELDADPLLAAIVEDRRLRK